MQEGIEVEKVSKSYGTVTALDDVSFTVEKGSLFALLGPNGAGKSTMIALLSTITNHDRGIIKVNGYQAGQEDEEIRKSIGVVFQNSMLDDLLSVEENLMIRCSCYGLFHEQAHNCIQKLDETMGLKEILYQKTSTLSSGQRRRVDIARALLANPSLLILDEPTASLDPGSRHQIWKMIHQLQKEQNMTIFLTTHYLEEAKYANQLCLLKKGKIIAMGTPQSMQETYGADHLYLYSSTPLQLVKQLATMKIACTMQDSYIEIETTGGLQALSILKRIERYLTNFEFNFGSLDDVFLQLMKGEDA